MPAHDRSPNGAPCWVELFTSDPDSAKAFYGGLLGWDAEEPDPELGGYANFTSGGVRVAGLMRNDGRQGAPDVWTTYLAVPDAAAAVEASTAAGAQLHVPVMPVADLGVMAAVTDPSGAFVGYWQPGTHEGYGRVAEVGAPCWHELHTRDYAAALGFYRTVHGWETKELSEATRRPSPRSSAARSPAILKLRRPSSSSLRALPESGSSVIVSRAARTLRFRPGCIVRIVFATGSGTRSR